MQRFQRGECKAARDFVTKVNAIRHGIDVVLERPGIAARQQT
jgi:hypothetical protein